MALSPYYFEQAVIKILLTGESNPVFKVLEIAKSKCEGKATTISISVVVEAVA